jgi:hypothetical protein
MATYTLKNVDDSLWRTLKKQAVDEGITIQSVIIKAIRQYLSKKEG